jgi:glycosyltransferase involved in cell wall biosynthesis
VEPFGMTALEAMYYRKPVIVPQIGGVDELVENGVTGFCVDANNINAVVEKIELLASDKNIYTLMSVAAFAKAAKFTQKKFHQSILRTIIKLQVKKNAEHATITVDNEQTPDMPAEEYPNKYYQYRSPATRIWNI